MFGWLQGSVVEIGQTTIVLAVQGVGYEITVGEDLCRATAEGQNLTMFTHLVVKQDAFELYGFESVFVRNLFRKLMQVSGVGAKFALSIVSTISATEVLQSIQLNEPKVLSRAPGIGTRVANRIITDLQGKIDDLAGGEGLPESGDMKTKQDAIQALVSLGYPLRDASEAVGGAWIEGMTLEVLIRRSLQRLRIS